MDEQSFTEPEANENKITQPGDRLRRILSEPTSQENSGGMFPEDLPTGDQESARPYYVEQVEPGAGQDQSQAAEPSEAAENATVQQPPEGENGSPDTEAFITPSELELPDTGEDAGSGEQTTMDESRPLPAEISPAQPVAEPDISGDLQEEVSPIEENQPEDVENLLISPAEEPETAEVEQGEQPAAEEMQPMDIEGAESLPEGTPEAAGGSPGREFEQTVPTELAENLEATRPSTASPAPAEGSGKELTPEELEELAKTPPSGFHSQRTMASGSVFRGQVPPPPYSKDPGELPKRIEESDLEATKVTPAALAPPGSCAPARISSPTQPQRIPIRSQTGRPAPAGGYQRSASAGGSVAPPAQPPRNGSVWRKPLGCLLRILIAFLFLGVLVLLGVGSFLVYKYYTIAASLPSVDDLRSRASQFETTRILDRDGNVIYEIIDPNAGKRTYVPIEKMSPYIIATTLATEDKDFYTHPGFDPVAIARSLWWNYTSGRTVSGASTITQQLARTLLLSPEDRYAQTVERKAREIVLAAEITRKYSKEEILELYLNENNYGNLSYGIEAAAETYFNTTVDKLTLGQAAFLAGIPQSPAIYDIHSNREETLERFRTVVVLTYQLSQERNCIYVSTALREVCVSQQDAMDAVTEIETYAFQPASDTIQFPHWVDYVRRELEARYDPNTIYRSGFTVYTTLDPELQKQAENLLRERIAQMAENNAKNGALVAIRPNTGEILAMVGSPDFYNEAISGQVNMAIHPRQPGSAIKPLTYAATFEKGWTPSTLIWDVPSEFPPSGDPQDTREPYRPVNYDGRFHGPVTVRSALANSYNVPAVKALQFVGIYDNPATPQADGLINFATRLGITTLTRNDYGLSLTLGGGEVSLLEMTSAFSVFANNGSRVAPVAITKIVNSQGELVYEYQPPAGDQVLRSEHAYLISSILSDNQARAPMFGEDSVLTLGFPAAVKTGTTNDFRDNWTIGYTPDIAVGVWVGNADYTPMENTTGLSGAAPVWSEFMKFAIQELTGGIPNPFVRPAGVVDRVVCTFSGTEPSEWCPQQRSEMFAYDQLPPSRENDLWIKAKIDTWTGLRASSACADFVDEKFALNVQDESAIKWILETAEGNAWAEEMGFQQPIYFAPQRECTSNDARPLILFAGLSENQTIDTNPLAIYALIKVPEPFNDYVLAYGLGDDPAEWKEIYVGNTQSDQPQFLTDWDVSEIPAGRVTLRIYLTSQRDTYAERRIHLNLQVPTPTVTPTPTLTPTGTPTSTPTVTKTPLPTSTPTTTKTPLPSSTPTVTETPKPTNTPTATPTTPSPAPTGTLTQTPSETSGTVEGTVET